MYGKKVTKKADDGDDDIRAFTAESPTNAKRLQQEKDAREERHAQKKRVLLTKTAAQQTLKELRNLARDIHRTQIFLGMNEAATRTPIDRRGRRTTSTRCKRKKCWRNLVEKRWSTFE